LKTGINQYLRVDEIHEICYQIHGNPNGEKVMFLHGGPGSKTSKSDLDFFNLEKVHLIMFDQRACGNSIPKGELNNNTTQNLIEDINKLLLHLNFDRVILFGGSWGSTLSLLFGIKYPDKVNGMILRGLFTATKEERKHFEQGGTKEKFPQIWNRFESMVPVENRLNVSNYYFDKILNGERVIQEKLAYELSYYGYYLSSEENDKNEIERKLMKSDHLTGAKILSHYSLNNFFIPDRFIEKNIQNLSEIPIKIIHGLNDYITLPEVAINMSKRLSNIELTLVEGGHSRRDKNIKSELVKAMEKMIK